MRRKQVSSLLLLSLEEAAAELGSRKRGCKWQCVEPRELKSNQRPMGGEKKKNSENGVAPERYGK